MKTITTEELKSLQKKSDAPALVNTLKADSFEMTRIPGAVNIPEDESDFVSRVEQEAGGKHKAVVVYCANEQCNSSEQAAEKLENAGFTNVLRYTGGAAAWQEETQDLPANSSR
jgi:rhodanese-related sulfurtransferase